MGQWGTSVSSSDTFMEVYESFFNYYNKNLSIEEIKQKMNEDFKSVHSNALTCNDYWFALAKSLWECKALDQEILNKIKTIVDSKSDLEVWRSLEASEKDIKAREIALEKFVSTISVEKDKAKARKKITYYSGYYEKGTCLSFQMKNGRFGGLVVIEQELNTLTGKNFVLATDINKDSQPDINDFLNSKVLTARHTDSLGYFREYFWKLVFESKYKRLNKDIESNYIRIGKIPLHIQNHEAFEHGVHYCDIWTRWIAEIEDSIAKINKGEKENISSTLIEWIGLDSK